MRPIRLALVCDYLEEKWASMDLVAEMLAEHLARHHGDDVEVTRIRPPFRERARRVPIAGRSGVAQRTDLVLNRFADYPSALRKLARSEAFDLFHIVDHSYAQLVHALPPARTVVTCHDLDTFRCLLAPEAEPRPAWFRTMMRRTLSGLQRASAIACDSDATRLAILGHGLVPEARLRTVHLGTHPECSPDPDPDADRRATELLGPRDPAGAPDLLHVGTNNARKRIDVLLATFAGVKKVVPGARLIKVGGAFNADQTRLARELGVLESVLMLPYFSPRESKDRAALAAVYRRASLVLQPSDAEGFGLPVAEAMACGVPLLASDLPVLREVAGGGALYAPVGDVPAWTEAALRLLDEQRSFAEPWQRRRTLGFERSRLFRWQTHVASLLAIYRDLRARSAGRRAA